MRNAVIAAITSAATMRCRRAAASGLAVMSGAVVTGALFPDLGGGVNVGDVAAYVRVMPRVRGWAKRLVRRSSKSEGGSVPTIKRCARERWARRKSALAHPTIPCMPPHAAQVIGRAVLGWN